MLLIPTSNISLATKRKHKMSRLWVVLSAGGCQWWDAAQVYEKWEENDSVTCEESWSLNTNKNHNKYRGKTFGSERVRASNTTATVWPKLGGRWWGTCDIGAKNFKNYCNQAHREPSEPTHASALALHSAAFGIPIQPERSSAATAAAAEEGAASILA